MLDIWKYLKHPKELQCGPGCKEATCVVFLDFDGVLNAPPYHEDYIFNPLQDRFIPLLNEILEKSGAKLVISSAWRMEGVEECKRYLWERNCVGEVISRTPAYAISGDDRGFQIQEWLDVHPNVTNYCIIDDSSDMAHLIPKLVHTNPNHGLTPKDVETALALLKE